MQKKNSDWHKTRQKNSSQTSKNITNKKKSNVKLLKTGGSYKMKNSEPKHTELLPHNIKTYHKTIKLLRSNERVCFVQPTGTGKSSIITALIEKFLMEDCHILILTSSSSIRSQFRDNYIDKLSDYYLKTSNKAMYHRLECNVHIDLYCSIRYHPEKYQDLKYIILDEFHRAGSYQNWLELQNLITKNPDAQLIGATATDIRNDGNDMNDSLFANCCSNRTDLIDAIKYQQILPDKGHIPASESHCHKNAGLKEIFRHLAVGETQKRKNRGFRVVPHPRQTVIGIRGPDTKHMLKKLPDQIIR